MTVHKNQTYSAKSPFPPTPVVAGFQPGEPFTLVRPAIATLSGAEGGPFNSTTFPPLTTGFACDGYDTVYVGVNFTGTGTVQISPMFYDVNMDLWVDCLVAGAVQMSDPLDGSGAQLSQLKVFGRHVVLFRVAVLTGGPLTALEIYVMPGTGRTYAFFG